MPSPRKLVATKIAECLARAEEHYGQEFDCPAPDFTLRGKRAGYVEHHRRTFEFTKLRFNDSLLRQNLDDFIERTVPHEIAHIISITIYHDEGGGHGHRFREVCAVLGMIDDTQFHDYDVAEQCGRIKHQCTGCSMVITVNRIIKGRIRRRTHTYRCQACGTPILL